MTPPPGDRLRAIAIRVCDGKTIERVIDPMVADLRIEYHDAVNHGRLWRGRWLRFAGCLTFIEVLAICGCQRVLHRAEGWTADDHRALGRAIEISTVAIVAATLLLLVAPMRIVPFKAYTSDWWRMIAYLIPQAIPLAMPVGFTLGVLWGLRRRAVSRHVKTAVLTLAIICSLGSFGTMAWIRPAANQAFREFTFSRIARDWNASTRRPPPKGTNELTLAELRQRMDSRPHADHIARDIAFTYHMVWALPWATLVLALFALTINRWQIRRISLCVIGFSTYLGYYLVLLAGRAYALDGTLPAYVAAWLPNIVFAASSAALAKVSSTQTNAGLVSAGRDFDPP